MTDVDSEERMAADSVPGSAPDDTVRDDVASEEPPTNAESAKRAPSFLRWTLETIVMIALAFLLAQGVKTFILQPFVIPTGSMEPTIMAGDRVLAEKVTYRFRDLRAGEIVVFDDPTGRHPQLIKRVIAVGGETIDIRGGRVFVDGARLHEPYLDGVQTDAGNVLMPLELAPDEIWLMGDNRPGSGDSRLIGAVDVSLVQGRAFAIYWPLNRMGPLR